MVGTLASLSGAKWSISREQKKGKDSSPTKLWSVLLNVKTIGHKHWKFKLHRLVNLIYSRLPTFYYEHISSRIIVWVRKCLIIFVHLRTFLNNYILPSWNIGESNRIFRSFCIACNYLCQFDDLSNVFHLPSPFYHICHQPCIMRFLCSCAPLKSKKQHVCSHSITVRRAVGGSKSPGGQVIMWWA